MCEERLKQLIYFCLKRQDLQGLLTAIFNSGTVFAQKQIIWKVMTQAAARVVLNKCKKIIVLSIAICRWSCCSEAHHPFGILLSSDSSAVMPWWGQLANHFSTARVRHFAWQIPLGLTPGICVSIQKCTEKDNSN